MTVREKNKKLPVKGDGGFVNFLKNNQNMIGNYVPLAGGAISALDSFNGETSDFGATASGLLSGVGAGASFGVPGMLIGGAISGVTSLFQNITRRKAEERAKKQAEEQRQQAELSMRRQAQDTLNRNFNKTGMDVPGYYAKGGPVKKPTVDRKTYELAKKNYFESLTQQGRNLPLKNGLYDSMEAHSIMLNNMSFYEPGGWYTTLPLKDAAYKAGNILRQFGNYALGTHYAKGGSIKQQGQDHPLYPNIQPKFPVTNEAADYIAEGEETIQHNPWSKPKTVNGSLRRISSDMSEINGPKHSSPSGGVQMSGGDRIFSDRLRVNPVILKSIKKNL